MQPSEWSSIALTSTPFQREMVCESQMQTEDISLLLQGTTVLLQGTVCMASVLMKSDTELQQKEL